MVSRILLVASVILLLACGGRSTVGGSATERDSATGDSGTPGDSASPDDALDAPYPEEDGSVDAVGPEDACPRTECPAGATLGFDCVCRGADAGIDACAPCPPYTTQGGDCACFGCGVCPYGWILEPSCGCSPPIEDAGPADAPADVSVAPEAGCYSFCPSGYFPDCSCKPSPPDSGCYSFCPAGYTQNADCSCSPLPMDAGCDAPCPPGFLQNADCSCVFVYDAGPYCGKCPSGTSPGPEACSCIPLDASLDAPVDGSSAGPGCWLGYANDHCASNTWCSLHSCPDGTQTGCFCREDGTASCYVECTPPPPCYIPNYGNCPSGATCVVGACPSPGVGSISCYCYQGGSYSCDSSCSGQDGGIADAAPDAPSDASGGPGCWFSLGYFEPQYVASGTYYEFGVCQDGITPFGCFCNADGTANCNLECPPPPPCHIPSYGDCPANTSCNVGSCPDGGGAIACYCSQSGYYTCSGGCEGSDSGSFFPLPFPRGI